MRALCEDALDQVLAQTREKSIAMGFEALRFRKGAAVLARLKSEPPDPLPGRKTLTHLLYGHRDHDLD